MTETKLFKISNHFEKEIFFIRKQTFSDATKFYKANSVVGYNKKSFPEYDVIKENRNGDKLYIEVKTQMYPAIEMCEINKGMNIQRPSGLSQCLADVYYFFKVSEKNDIIVNMIDNDQSIKYDLYVVSKSDIIDYMDEDLKNTDLMEIVKNDMIDTAKEQEELDKKDPNYQTKYDELEKEYYKYDTEYNELEKKLYFSEFKKLNSFNYPNAKTGLYDDNTGFGVVLRIDSFINHQILTNGQSVIKSVKDALVSVNTTIKGNIITGPDQKILKNTIQPIGKLIDPNIPNELKKWMPDNVDNDIQNLDIEVDEYKIPSGYGAGYDSDSSSDSSDSGSSSDSDTGLQFMNLIKR
jgi:hypothetical protein